MPIAVPSELLRQDRELYYWEEEEELHQEQLQRPYLPG